MYTFGKPLLRAENWELQWSEEMEQASVYGWTVRVPKEDMGSQTEEKQQTKEYELYVVPR